MSANKSPELLDGAALARGSSRLANFPRGFFGVTMGILGFGLALRSAELVFASQVAGWFGAALLAGLLIALALKGFLHTQALKADWSHPVKIAFFPATSISLLLLATLVRNDAPEIAQPLWILGAMAQAILTVVVVSTWIGHRAFGPGHLSPAWFIPAVGNVVVPLAGVPLGHVELSWYFFAVGLLFWIVLLTIVFNRLIFHEPLPGRLRPTLVILIAPPAVGFLAWVQLHGGAIDDMARLLINMGYFFTLLVAVQARELLRLPFALSFWALSFPLAAITVASFRFADLMHSPFHRSLGFLLLSVLVIIVAGLIWRTIRATVAGEICQPE